MSQFTDKPCPCCDQYMAFVGQQTRADGTVYNLIHCTNVACDWKEATHAEGGTEKLWQAWGSPRMKKDGAA